MTWDTTERCPSCCSTRKAMRGPLKKNGLVYECEDVWHNEASASTTTTAPDRDPLLVARQRTHGDFATGARISQRLKAIFATSTGGLMSAEHREAMDMIALKLSRILSGQANYCDHWDDIAGYAKLASEACKDD